MVNLTANANKNLIPVAIVCAGLIVAGAIIFSGFYNEAGPAAVVQPPAGEEQFDQNSKRDVPDVKLFVMSYCPFGLQMQKAFLPVYNLLSDKADMGVYFVDYIMHEKAEIDENLRQYCIQREESEKYSDYLACFVQDGDFEACLGQAEINRQKLQTCIAQTDRDYKVTQGYQDKNSWLQGQFPLFGVNTDLCQKYGVKGSPTLVVNDVIKTVDRSPEAVKQLICQAFKEKPKECGQVLSVAIASPGLGQGSGGTNSGGCQ